jgi:hypothetical protein
MLRYLRSRAALPTLLVLLVVSLAGNVILALVLSSAFEKLQVTRIFPLGYVPQGTPASPGGAKPFLAFWGDSRASFWASEARAAGRDVVNLAHGGQTSSQVLLQIRATPLDSRYAVAQFGINDIHPLGTLPEHRAIILERLHGNIIAVRDALLERSDVVILTTIFPPGRVPLQRRAFWDSRSLEYIEHANAAILAAADGVRVFVIDAHAILCDERGYLRPEYRDHDFFLHVNREAYAALNAELGRVLDESAARRGGAIATAPSTVGEVSFQRENALLEQQPTRDR